MKETFRLSMAWLHTWVGLWLGWLLFVIFLTGTLSIFDDAITHWMKDKVQNRNSIQTATLSTAEERLSAIKQAQQFLEKTAPQSHYWGIGLPRKDDPFLLVSWEDQNEKHQETRLNLTTGQPELDTSRKTEGGHHFIDMHYKLHMGTVGYWIVGIAAMAMLTALISGIVTHKRIFKDFFTFRPNKGQRSWLDAHNALGVLTLPFLFVITYSGLTIMYSTYMPLGIATYYEKEDAFYQELTNELPHRDIQKVSAPVVQLATFLQQAENNLGRPIEAVSIEHPGDISSSATFYGAVDSQINEKRLLNVNGGNMVIDAVNGKTLAIKQPEQPLPNDGLKLENIFSSLHYVQFGGVTLKWLYFLCGIAATVMIATGLILFTVKRRKKQFLTTAEFGNSTIFVYRIIESMNIATIAGLAIACISYFWINRLLPLDLDERASWEIGLFFVVWIITVIHAFIRQPMTAWIEQLAFASLLCLLLPIINISMTGHYIGNYFSQGEWGNMFLELTIMVIGLLLTYATKHVLKKRIRPVSADINKSSMIPAIEK